MTLTFGTNQHFYHVWTVVVQVWELIVAASKFLYIGNSVAIVLLGIISVVGIGLLILIRFVIISGRWLTTLPIERRRFYEQLRMHLCRTKIWTLGAFVITSVVFVIVSSLAGAAPGTLSSGDLGVISFLGKGIMALCVFVRVLQMAVALKQTV